MLRTPLLLTPFVLLALLPATASAAECETKVGNDSFVITSARDVSCADAARDLARARNATAATFRTPGRFTCKRGMNEVGRRSWRCTRGTEAYRFEIDSTNPGSRVITCRATSTTRPDEVITSVRGVACTQAARIHGRYKGARSMRFSVPLGWTCMKLSSTQWRCTKGADAYRFNVLRGERR